MRWRHRQPGRRSALNSRSPRSRCSDSRPPAPNAQYALEAQYDALLKADNLKEWLAKLAARPHHVGSPYGKANAEFIAGLFKSWGYETAIEQFDVLFPTPTVRVLELVAPQKVAAKLVEPALKEDSTSGQTAEQLPVYNAYSVDGDVTAELVYVNYGVPRDYEVLAERGIDVKGKIVIARYGGSWRGIKPKVAAEHGAIGCLIYSDPRDDGYFQGDVYPKGAWRPEHRRAARLGARHARLPRRSADARTSARPRTRSASTREEAPTLTKIPVLPIAYADALPLLRGAGRAGRAGGMARSASDHLSPRARAGEGAPEARSSTGSSRRPTT